MISLNVLGISEVPTEGRDLGEGAARTRYTLSYAVAPDHFNHRQQSLFTSLKSSHVNHPNRLDIFCQSQFSLCGKSFNKEFGWFYIHRICNHINGLMGYP